MKKILVPLVVCFALPVTGFAQPITDCPDCVLGLYDQPLMLTNYGNVAPFVEKTIYLGIYLGSGQQGLTGIEFSVAGIGNSEYLVLGVEGITDPPPIILIGSVAAPTDTSATSTLTGGMNIAWPACIVGSQSLVQIRLLPLAPVPNRVFRVMHKFPPTNLNYGLSNPILIKCDVPQFSPVRVQGGCYIAGWNGTTPVPCAPIDIPVAATPLAWGAVKGLYR